VQYTDGRFAGINANNLHRPFPDGAFGFDGNPDYLTENVGIFMTERRSFGTVDIEAAVRKDFRRIDVGVPSWRSTVGPELAALFVEWFGADWRQILENEDVEGFRSMNPTVRHSPFSASIGATWNVGQGYALALSFGHTERAPSVRELYARGNNLATNSYELGLAVGNPTLDEAGLSAEDVLETTDAINLTLRRTRGPLKFEVGLFYQKVDDYVFARLMETETATGTPHNFLIYTAAEARFTGIDGQVSYQFTPGARVTVFGDYVDAKLKSENDNLPRIPPGRLGARYDVAAGPLTGDLEYYHTFKQGKVASYETRTAGYDMVNATLSYRFALSKKTVDLYLRGSNLLNELAFAHTSFVKDQSPLRGRNFVIGIKHAF
jgi:iron complex outermembrane receptor protein